MAEVAPEIRLAGQPALVRLEELSRFLDDPDGYPAVRHPFAWSRGVLGTIPSVRERARQRALAALVLANRRPQIPARPEARALMAALLYESGAEGQIPAEMWGELSGELPGSWRGEQAGELPGSWRGEQAGAQAALSRGQVAAAYAELRGATDQAARLRAMSLLCAPVEGEGEPARLRRMLALLALPELAMGGAGIDPLLPGRRLIREFERIAGRDLSPNDRPHELIAALVAAGLDLETGAATGF